MRGDSWAHLSRAGRATEPQKAMTCATTSPSKNGRSIVNTFANLDFWPFLPKTRFQKSNRINRLRFDQNLVFAPFRYLAKVLIVNPLFHTFKSLYRLTWFPLS